MIIIDELDEDFATDAEWLSFLADMRYAMDNASSIDDATEIKGHIDKAEDVLKKRGVAIPPE